MIQFNLLPDVKIESIKAAYRRRLVLTISIVASLVSILLFVVLFLYVRVNQTKYMGDLDKDIKTNTAKIQSIQDLDKVLTIQNQLNSLPDLHNKKVVSSRLVDYLNQLVPSQAALDSVQLDFTGNTMSLTGKADSIGTVNKFVDTLKFTTFKVNDNSAKEGKAFSNVVLQSFGVSAAQNTQGTNFSLALTFDAAIFANTTEEPKEGATAVTLNVPNIISTRSVTEKPSDLFSQKNQNDDTQSGQGR